LSGLTPDALAAWLADRDVPAYRARQVADGVWGGAIGSINQVYDDPAKAACRSVDAVERRIRNPRTNLV
jgi:hypothetical protein